MNKFLIFALSLLLASCTNNSGLRQNSYSAGEQLLYQGVADYNKDHYLAAQQKFYRALVFFQSIDNTENIQLARINLVEALLAVSNFSDAQKQLSFLIQGGLFKERITLLKVKLLFQQQQYRKGLAVIRPLLLQQDSNKRLDLLATAARLETLIAEKAEQQWLSKFQAALLRKGSNQPKYQVVLKRINALIAVQHQQYQQAVQLLNESVTFYKQHNNRRAIAACLVEIAEIEIKQQYPVKALNYLNRALNIRTWLKDPYQVDKIKKIILRINK